MFDNNTRHRVVLTAQRRYILLKSVTTANRLKGLTISELIVLNSECDIGGIFKKRDAKVNDFAISLSASLILRGNEKEEYGGQ